MTFVCRSIALALLVVSCSGAYANAKPGHPTHGYGHHGQSANYNSDCTWGLIRREPKAHKEKLQTATKNAEAVRAMLKTMQQSSNPKSGESMQQYSMRLAEQSRRAAAICKANAEAAAAAGNTLQSNGVSQNH